jgi:hypothetical protein
VTIYSWNGRRVFGMANVSLRMRNVFTYEEEKQMKKKNKTEWITGCLEGVRSECRSQKSEVRNQKSKV